MKKKQSKKRKTKKRFFLPIMSFLVSPLIAALIKFTQPYYPLSLIAPMTVLEFFTFSLHCILYTLALSLLALILNGLFRRKWLLTSYLNQFKFLFCVMLLFFPLKVITDLKNEDRSIASPAKVGQLLSLQKIAEALLQYPDIHTKFNHEDLWKRMDSINIDSVQFFENLPEAQKIFYNAALWSDALESYELKRVVRSDFLIQHESRLLFSGNISKEELKNNSKILNAIVNKTPYELKKGHKKIITKNDIINHLRFFQHSLKRLIILEKREFAPF